MYTASMVHYTASLHATNGIHNMYNVTRKIYHNEICYINMSLILNHCQAITDNWGNAKKNRLSKTISFAYQLHRNVILLVTSANWCSRWLPALPMHNLSHFTTGLAAFHVPSGLFCMLQQYLWFVTAVYLLSVTPPDKPTPSCIPRRKSQGEWGEMISTAATQVFCYLPTEMKCNTKL